MLREQLGAVDGVVAGLGATIGAGLFAGLAPASSFAGHWLLAAMAIAAIAAACCAFSTGDQSGSFPGSGGGYKYTREQLGRWPGRMAGGLYLAGRAGAAAALAGCFGAYIAPDRPALPALGLLVLAVAADAAGLRPPKVLSRWLVGFVLVVLALVVAACFAIAPPPPTGVPVPAGSPGLDDAGELLPAAGVLFFAFLGFERITAPGADQPVLSKRRLRVVIPVLLLVAFGTYFAVGAAVLRQLGPTRLAVSTVPLRDALDAASAGALDPLVTVAVLVATGVALLLVVGGGRRVANAMADGGDLPVDGALPVTGSLVRWLVGAGAVACVLFAGPAGSIALAATCALFYYAFTNASARLLPNAERSWPARTACFGLGFTVLIGMTMPPVDLAVALGVALLAALAGPLLGSRR
ncbi:MAG TPA: amino acid permease [Pseudonocardiaceae bacterium]|nr:amino acid permease [Pseudonocardiaceae bacterium]